MMFVMQCSGEVLWPRVRYWRSAFPVTTPWRIVLVFFPVACRLDDSMNSLLDSREWADAQPTPLLKGLCVLGFLRLDFTDLRRVPGSRKALGTGSEPSDITPNYNPESTSGSRNDLGNSGFTLTNRHMPTILWFKKKHDLQCSCKIKQVFYCTRVHMNTVYTYTCVHTIMPDFLNRLIL